MKEKTLSIIKPDGVSKNIIGEIISRFEKQGLKIAALKKIHISKAQAEGFYIVHKARPFYESLTNFMCEGPIVVIVAEGLDAINKVREIMGATNPKDAKAGTIRADFADNVERNIVHGSDSPQSAAFEIPYFFSATEIF
ncbi:nucleoside diphosphate kinase [Candidatus Magnetoovum chiemensis]|nr:nucleoside diphosphate kinase [Candidatus Magnetoovum chiemensis]